MSFSLTIRPLNLCIDKEIGGLGTPADSLRREKLFSVATVKKTRRGCSSIWGYYTTFEYYHLAKFKPPAAYFE